MNALEEKMLRVVQRAYAAMGAVEFVGGFENLVYRVRRDGGERILRLTRATDRTAGEIEAELDWMGDLFGRGIPVVEPLAGVSGERLEKVTGPAGELYYASMFGVAPGGPVDVSDESVWNEGLFEQWGEMLGRMHVAAMEYAPGPGRPRRRMWHEDALLAFEEYLPVGDEGVIEAARGIVEELSRLSTSRKEFGLIHSDLHHGNFFVDEGEMTIFDFDDSAYHWFVCDIATVIYSVCWWTVEGDEARQNAFAERFGRALLKGYRRHKAISREWLGRIPLFLALRDATVYTVLHKRFDVETMDERLKGALAERRARLLGEGSPIAIDFGGL